MSVVCVPFFVTISEIPIYRSHTVDLSLSRSIHCCYKCNLTGFNNCPSEIHYGQCIPAAHIGSFLAAGSAGNIVADINVSARPFPANLPHPLPLANTSKASRTIHHYKLGSSIQHQDVPNNSFTSSVSATIIPQRKVNIIQEKSISGDDSAQTDIKNLTKPQNKVSPHKQTNKVVQKFSDIPQFYFPRGKPKSTDELTGILKSCREKLQSLETKSNSSAVPLIHKSKMKDVMMILKAPIYWKQLVFLCSGGNDSSPHINVDNLLVLWQKIISNNHTDAAKFFALITQEKKDYIEPQDFYPLVQDVLETHPGLTFLLSARDFHSRYIATVVYRIYFGINSSWSGKITLQELEKSDLLSIIQSLENTDDINTITQYFSYEHFYVIYCKFWELDEDHDLVISKADLARHNNYAISERMIERIFSGAVTKSKARIEGLMTYTEFVWFLLAEEDKRHPRSIEYWFRCMDLDGDGVLSLYELEYFYQEQLFRMEEMGIEPISFEDCICQMLDMIKPRESNKIRLSDLKTCKLVHIFFDTFFNLTKYLEHEQRDPFTNLKDLEEGLTEMSDWDKYAAEAYEILVAEDASQDNYNDTYHEPGGQLYKNSFDQQQHDEEAVYENISSPNKQQTSSTITTTGGVKKPEKLYDSSKYNEFVNGKLADMTESAAVTTLQSQQLNLNRKN